MFSFFKKGKNEDKVPEWASFFSPREYRAFIAAVEAYFHKKNIPIKIQNGVVITDKNPAGFDRLGLLNIAQRCFPEGPNRYQDMVSAHFDLMAGSKQIHDDFSVLAETFEKAKRYLGIRLYPADQVGSLGEASLMARKLTDDIYSVLVFDLPDVIINVTRPQIKGWDKSQDELFRIGLKNIRKNYPTKVTSQKLGELDIWMAVGDHFFTPNIVLDLNPESKYIGSHGALVAIPNRHAVFIYPIDSMEVVLAINALIPITRGLYEKGPGSISDHLFLYREGQFFNIPYELDEDGMKIYPPDELTRLLEQLAG